MLDRDLEDLALADVGDCVLPDGAPPREQLDAARDEIAAWWRPGLLPFMLGGDHTATVPVIEVLAPHFPDLVEVAHCWDPSARTGITASWIIREALLAWWSPA